MASTEAIQRFREAASKSETPESRRAGAAFVPSPEDLFIVTAPKCGTTWCQQIVHMLRSRGDMSFAEISLVIPCLEMALDYGYGDLQAPQGVPQPSPSTAQAHSAEGPADTASRLAAGPGAPDSSTLEASGQGQAAPPEGWLPRAFKTHFWYPHCPKGQGAKHIYIIRDPRDAAVSFFHFFEGWFFQHGEIPLTDFLKHFYLQRHLANDLMEFPSIWQHMLSWWPLRGDPSVLWLFYEDMLEHNEDVVRLIAGFMGVDVASDPELLGLVLERSSLSFMKQHATKFDEHQLKLRINEHCGLDRRAGLDGINSGKVRKGSQGGWRAEMPEQLQAVFEARWRDEVAPVTGHATYEDLRAAVNRELQRPWAQA